MAITKKQHYRGSDFNNKELKDAKSLQLNEDAINADEAVRLSQSESIADQAAQDILVESGASSSTTTAFTSASMVSFLAAKQDNLSAVWRDTLDSLSSLALSLPVLTAHKARIPLMGPLGPCRTHKGP